ncbi:MAG TPA: glycerate kinase [Actinomycetota bacterium]|nr:glycerate kinase [Actinomycetota bacterium]
MHVLVAPDKFRGTLTAAEAARAIGAGWRRARPQDEVEELPLADGGEGTLDALVAALGGERRSLRVRGPLGDPVDADYGLVSGRHTGVVEMARASGLLLVPEGRRDVFRATTYGTGELIRAACRDGAREVVVCIGGSATNDGGAGMAQAVGARLVDGAGADVRPGAAGLLDLAAIDVRGLDRAVRDARFMVACDVDNPLTGPQGAAAVYGPQKGAAPDDVVVLDRALGHLAAVIHRDLGIDVRDLPGAGAAGGLGAGLVAFLGARLRPGAEVVKDAVGFEERLARADLVITGEGTLDEQSLRGKLAASVLSSAHQAWTPVLILCGRAQIGVQGVRVASLVNRFGERRALGEARRALEDLAFEAASATAPEPPG